MGRWLAALCGVELARVRNFPSLVTRAQSGDETAFDAIFEQFADPLYRYLVVCSGDAHLADKLTGDLWVHVVEHLPAFRFLHTRSEAAFAAWLYHMAKNLLDDVYSRSSREQVIPREMLPSDELLRGEQVITREAKHPLSTMVAHLTPEEREVVLFRLIEERPIADTALFMGCSEGWVKTLQYRVLHALKDLPGGSRGEHKGQ